MNTTTSNDDDLVSFSEAAALIPCPRRGKRTHIATLHRWVRSGRIQAVCQQRGKVRYWFLTRAELERLCEGEKAAMPAEPLPRMRSPAKRQRDIDRAMKSLAAMGC